MEQQVERRVSMKPVHPASTIDNKTNKRRLWASVCYYFPQYTLETASKLSVRDIRLLLGTARRIEAERLYNLVQIVASPHTKKGKGVKTLTDHFRREMGR